MKIGICLFSMSTVVLGAAALLAPRVLAKPSEVTDKKKFKEEVLLHSRSPTDFVEVPSEFRPFQTYDVLDPSKLKQKVIIEVGVDGDGMFCHSQQPPAPPYGRTTRDENGAVKRGPG